MRNILLSNQNFKLASDQNFGCLLPSVYNRTATITKTNSNAETKTSITKKPEIQCISWFKIHLMRRYFYTSHLQNSTWLASTPPHHGKDAKKLTRSLNHFKISCFTFQIATQQYWSVPQWSQPRTTQRVWNKKIASQSKRDTLLRLYDAELETKL